MNPEVDSQRSRRLLFSPELAAGTLRESDLARAPVRAATQSRRVPSRVSRTYQRRLLGRGALRYEAETVQRAMAAREAVLGDAALGAPRLLVRLVAPGGDVAADAAKRAHAALAEAGVAHLVSVAPGALDDARAEQVAELRRAGVAFGMHGIGGGGDKAPHRLKPDALAARLEAAERSLAEHAIAPEVLVAAERFGRRQWETLAARFAVVAAGAGAVDWLGYHDTPLWRGDAVWMPSYPPFDGPATGALEGVRELVHRGAALWVPVTIDAAAEVADGGAGLRAFAAEAAAHATPWPSFLDAVRASARG